MKRLAHAWIVTVVALALSTGFGRAYAGIAFSAKPYDIWSVAVTAVASNVDGKDKHEIVLGTVDSCIALLDHSGKTLWRKELGGIPSAVCTGDVDRDGREEIGAVVQDVRGRVSIFDCQGKILTDYTGDVSFVSLTMGDVDGDGGKEVVAGDVLGFVHLLGKDGRLQWKKSVANSAVGSLGAGDLNGDGKAEIVVGTHEDGVIALDHDGKEIWRVSKRLDGTGKFPSVKRSWIRSIVVDDIDLDGKPEIVSGSRPNGMVSVLDGQGRPIWERKFPNTVNNYSTSLVGVGDLMGDGKKEIVSMFHGVIVNGQKGRSPFSVIDYKGNVISEYEPDANFYGFCLYDLDQDGKSEMLTTSATRGRRFFVLNAQEGNRAGVEGLSKPLPGEMSRFTQKAASSSGLIPGKEGSSPFQILYVCRASDPYLQEIHDFLSLRESDSLKFLLLLEGIHEEGKTGRRGRGGGKRGRSEQSEILKTVQRLESRKIPFFLLAGAHCRLHMGIDTLEKILNVAPKQCKGFVFHEDSYSSANWGEFVDNLQKVLSLCKKHGGKKLILNEHLDFWYRIPRLASLAPQLFNSTFSDVLVPMYKTNRYVMPELNLGSILGLWKAGNVGAWGLSTQDDAWKWESIFMVPPDDVLLRMEVLAASLGARYFRIERGKEFLEVVNGKISLSSGAKNHRDLFHHLIRKNVIRPVEKSSQVILSPVALQQPAWGGWTGPAGPKAYWHHFYTSALRDRVSGYQFPLQKVSDEYLGGYAYGLRYYAEAMFPKTRYGFFQMIPQWIPAQSIVGVRKVWRTDGAGWYDEQKTRNSPVTRESVLRNFEDMAETMPFRGEGVFLSAQKFSGDYLVYLMDPGCLDIEGVDTVLVINRSLGACAVTDAISGEMLSVKDGKLPLRVPTGGFRILKVVPSVNAKV